MALLSMDRVVLGDIPLFTRERKILFVKNNSSEHKISFTWHVTNPEHIRVKFSHFFTSKWNTYSIICKNVSFNLVHQNTTFKRNRGCQSEQNVQINIHFKGQACFLQYWFDMRGLYTFFWTYSASQSLDEFKYLFLN